MQKCRLLKKLQGTMNPLTPRKRSELIKSLLNNGSPNSVKTRELLETGNYVVSKRTQVESKISCALLTDMKNGFKALKLSGRKSANVRENSASVCIGSTVEQHNLKKRLSDELGLDRRLINKSVRKHKKLVSGEEEALKCTVRKVRKDSLNEETKSLIYNFWCKYSVPVNDKKIMVRERIGPKVYAEHNKHILTQTQTEIFLEFRKAYPEIKIQQRLFEMLRPFYIKPANRRDRLTCLCKQHIEMNLLFKAAKQNREKLCKLNILDKNEFKVWESLSDLVQETLCNPVEVNGKIFHKSEYLDRTCHKCGVNKIRTSAMEMSEDSTIKWQKYCYVDSGKRSKDGKCVKELKLLDITSPPKDLWLYLKEKLDFFPRHQFQAYWQKEQLHNIRSNLPIGHVLLVHDYAHDFTLETQDEVQTQFFSKSEVAMHVSVLYRHSVLEVDGKDSTTDDPSIVKEYIFTIFEDTSHDRDTVHHVRKLIIEKYLQTDLQYPLLYIHEFTDGCSAQYKSKFCMGDVSYSQSDFGCITQRNYFETSHGKGEQDAAGSHVKNKVLMSIIRRECKIQSAKAMYDFLTKSFSVPATSTYQSRTENVQLRRRIFFYASTADIDKQRHNRDILAVPGNRLVHSVRGIENNPGEISIRTRSCYCDMCLDENYKNCYYKEVIGGWKKQKLELEPDSNIIVADICSEEDLLSSLVVRNDIIVVPQHAATVTVSESTEEFRLVKVTSDGCEVARKMISDSAGSCFQKGEFLLKGKQLRALETELHYELDSSNVFYIDPRDVRHILKPEDFENIAHTRGCNKKQYCLCIGAREEIMASL